MTRRDALKVAGVVAALVLTRSYWLSSSAPTWLRGASPFTWSETRAEQQRCLAFANMIGSKHPETYYSDEDPKASPVMKIERLVRGGHDSLGIEGTVTRGRYVNYVFYCATANVRGHPGEHRSEISEPWGNAADWQTVHRIDDRLAQSCVDSAASFFPTSRFAPRPLMLRPIAFRAHILLMARDTVYDVPPQIVSCWAEPGPGGEPAFVRVQDPTKPDFQ